MMGREWGGRGASGARPRARVIGGREVYLGKLPAARTQLLACGDSGARRATVGRGGAAYSRGAASAPVQLSGLLVAFAWQSGRVAVEAVRS